MLNHIVFPALICLIALVIAMIIAARSRARPHLKTYEYQPSPILTEHEARLFKRITRELPDYYIFPQVSMSAILKPKLKQKSQNYLAAFRAISQKRVDFLICDTALTILCLVELDDSTHKKEQDEARDQMTASAKYKTIRLRGNPDVIDLAPIFELCQKPSPPARLMSFIGKRGR